MARKVSREKVGTKETRKIPRTEVVQKEQVMDVSETKPGKEVTFKCKFCGAEKPLTEMQVVTRYFPPVVLCKECEKTA
ncbi:MAG: hypothetical protein HYX81_05030 [Chloroflexi bacterium]|nr:hypothetical protein [Chloroflexota bacterium]